MKKQNHGFTQAYRRGVVALALIVLSATLRADFFYVSVNGTNSPSYGTGYTALQAAIDASKAGDTVWIADGFVCDKGGTYVSGKGETNRIVVTKAITVRSVSGTKEKAAVIVGAHHQPGVTIYGTAAVRCLYATAAATFIGLQLTNGATSAVTSPYGGGAYLYSEGAGAMFSNCVIVANSSSKYGGGVYGGGIFSHCAILANHGNSRAGGVYGGTLRDCDLIDNKTLPSDSLGGGTYGSTVERCRFVGNYARIGAGAYTGTLTDCTLISNNCVWAGGGAYSATLKRCLLAFNTSLEQNGGGTSACNLSDCVLTGNSSANFGAAIHVGSALRCTITNNANKRIAGGVIYNCAVTNSLIKDNSFLSAYNGGVVNGGSLVNCLLIGNKTTGNLDAATAYGTQLFNSTVADTSQGKSVFNCTLVNSIVRGGSAATADLQNNNATKSCIAASAVLAGSDNIDADPLFIGTGEWPYRLSGSSPCIDQGLGGFVWMLPSDPNTRGLDFSGQRRVIGPAVDLGAFEFMPQGTTLLMR